MRIYSIFNGMNGECNSHGIGSLTTFIRTAGCTAGCVYCDTQYAADPDSGKDMTPGQIMNDVANLHFKRVTITGGEPFEQERTELSDLLAMLVRGNYHVTVETNGLHTFNKVKEPYRDVNFVVDIKLGHANDDCYISHILYMGLGKHDFLKTVIGSEADLLKALRIKEVLQKHHCDAMFAFSPQYGVVEPGRLVDLLIANGVYDGIVNFQAHKVLNLTEPK